MNNRLKVQCRTADGIAVRSLYLNRILFVKLLIVPFFMLLRQNEMKSPIVSKLLILIHLKSQQTKM